MSGDTPLHNAARSSRNPAVIDVLVAAGVDVEARELSGDTPLHVAAASNTTPAVLRALIEHGTDVNTRNWDGDTPLHRAVRPGREAGAAVQILLEAKANPLTQNAAGLTAWDLAQADDAIEGSEAYWHLRESWFDATHQDATTRPTGSSDATASDRTISAFSWLFGITVLILALALFASVAAAVFPRLFRLPFPASTGGRSDWHIGLIAASVALFGILITGVFVFMTLQINTTAERAARQRATTVARQVAEERATSVSIPIAETESSKQAVHFLESLSNQVTTEVTTGNNIDELTLGVPELASLGVAERQRFKLTAPETGRYRITARARTPDMDTILYVYDAGGALEAVNDDDAGSLNSLIEIQLEGGSASYVAVEELTGRPGECEVRVERIGTGSDP